MSSSVDRPVGAFIDDQGRTWKMRITYADLAELREIGVDLSKIKAQGPKDQAEFLFGVGSDDPIHGEAAVVNMCQVLCQDQIESLKLTPKQFARLFDGRVMGEATMAILEAIADFSHRSNPDTTAQAVRAIRMAFTRANQMVGGEMKDHMDQIEKMTDEQLKTSALSSLASAA